MPACQMGILLVDTHWIAMRSHQYMFNPRHRELCHRLSVYCHCCCEVGHVGRAPCHGRLGHPWLELRLPVSLHWSPEASLFMYCGGQGTLCPNDLRLDESFQSLV